MRKSRGVSIRRREQRNSGRLSGRESKLKWVRKTARLAKKVSAICYQMLPNWEGEIL
jgi:hypothetical protein